MIFSAETEISPLPVDFYDTDVHIASNRYLGGL